MTDKTERIRAIKELGTELDKLVRGGAGAELQDEFRSVVAAANKANPWFTPQSIHRALEAWAETLAGGKVDDWASRYNVSESPGSMKVGVINAGNIPFVGLHDLLSVVLSGHTYLGKNASDDQLLLPFAARIMIRKMPVLADRILFVPKMKDMDAVIATGSDNSARYFEYYFGKYPHIIRKNRNGIAILSGNESTEDLTALGDDIFTYYGLGCRNVAKMYVPERYVFDRFFESIYSFHDLMNFNKYMNNFDYNNSVLLLKQEPFLQNGFLIIREDERMASPISIVHYEYYTNREELEKKLSQQTESIQCIATSANLNDPNLRKLSVPFGKTQSPALMDYADGVDTVSFLCDLPY